MMMQWLVNEWKAFRDEINAKVAALQPQAGAENVAARIAALEAAMQKLKDDVQGLKMRMGKKN